MARRLEDLADRGCPLAYEPSGHDFLSPCLAEADLMRRVLEADRFAAWLGEFLPGVPTDGDGAGWLLRAVVTDAGDGKLVHLDGLSLSRAWMLGLGTFRRLPRHPAGAVRPRRAVPVGGLPRLRLGAVLLIGQSVARLCL